MTHRDVKNIIFVLCFLLFGGCNSLSDLKAYKMAASSMQPTIYKGDRIIVNLNYDFNMVKRGDVVIFKFPKKPERHWVKRIIAFGGETVEIREGKILIDGEFLAHQIIDSKVYVNAGDYGSVEKPIIVPDNHFFVLGDFSEKSFDSRYWGFLPKENLIGKAVKIYWPINRFGNIE